jgi:hypothetical protein
MLSRRSLLNWLAAAAITAAIGTPAATEAQAQPGPGNRPRRPPQRPVRPARRPPRPRPRRERRPSPRPGFIWVPGRWIWSARRGRWVWVSGHWARRRR